MSNKLLLMTGGGPRVQLPSSIDRSSVKGIPTDASAGFRLNTDGTIDATPNQSTTLSYTDDLGSWLLQGAASDYDAKVDNATPNALSGSLENTWLNLGTTRPWYAQVTGTGNQDCSSTLRIRDATTLVELASCPITMYAEST